jgi:hypothetical protein
VRFLECFAAEEHLPREEEWDHQNWKSPKYDIRDDKNLCQYYAEHSQEKVADDEFA